MNRCRIIQRLCAWTFLITTSLAQQNGAPTVTPASGPAPQPTATFQAARMVTVEVVARDHQGHPITGLTVADFQVLEQIAPKHDQHPQKIAGFRAVTVTEIAAHDQGKVSLPAGVYTNLVTMDKVPVPPTVLLVDGQKAELQEAACQDLLTSTSVLVVAKAYPGDQSGTVKYFMAIDPTTLTFAPQPDGLRELALRVGVCTFDKSGKPMQFLQDSVDAKLSDKQFAAI